MREIYRPYEVQNAAIIHNPASGTKERSKDIDDAAKRLQGYGKRVEVFPTLGPGHATELAREAMRRGYGLIFAAGGDGTLNETARALINSKTILGHIPFGTANVWASEAKISTDVIKAVDLAVSDYGLVRRMDTGRINNHPFLLMAGVGADGEVLNRVQKPGGKKSGKGVPQYVKEAIKVVPSYKGNPAELTVDGEVFTLPIVQVWFGNTQKLWLLVLRPEARADDGLLEATIGLGEKLSQVIPPVISAAFGRGKDTTHSKFVQGREFTLDFASPIAMEYDGEPSDRADHVEVKIVPDSLSILVSRKSSTIFSKPALELSKAAL